MKRCFPTQHGMLLPVSIHNKRSRWFSAGRSFKGARESSAVFQPKPPENRYNLNINSINSNRSWIKKAVKHAHWRINYSPTLPLIPLEPSIFFSLVVYSLVFYTRAFALLLSFSFLSFYSLFYCQIQINSYLFLIQMSWLLLASFSNLPLTWQDPQISRQLLTVYIFTHIHTRSRRSSPLVLQYRSVQDVRDWAIKWSSAPSSSLLSSFSPHPLPHSSPFITQFIHLLITYHISHLSVTYNRMLCSSSAAVHTVIHTNTLQAAF